MEEQVEDALDRLEAVEVDSERKIAEVEAEKAAAEQKLNHLGQEMKNRESKLQEKLSAIEVSMNGRKLKYSIQEISMAADSEFDTAHLSNV